MVEWYWVLVGIFVGGLLGVFITAMCVASDNAEEHQPRPGERKRGK